MSIMLSSLVVFLLLCLSLHACEARVFGIFNKELPLHKYHHLSKNNEMPSPARVLTDLSNAKSSSSSPTTRNSKPCKRVNSAHQANGCNNAATHATHHAGESHQPARVDDTRRISSSSNADDQSDSVTSISWRVRHNKQGDPQPEFNLDYLPARTHPPVHN